MSTIELKPCPKCAAKHDPRELFQWQDALWICRSELHKENGFRQSETCTESERDQLKARAAKLEEALLRERQSFVSIVSHLQGPNMFTIREPGTYIKLLYVYPDRSGYVSEIKKVEEVTLKEGEEPAYPCREWKEWHANRPKLEMPCKVSDLPEAALSSPAARDDGWIRVEDVNLQDGTEVLIAGHEYKDPSKPWFKEIAFYDSGAFYDRATGEEFYATHYRPLPTPPTEGGVL